MCKIAFAKDIERNAYELVLTMIKHQENVVAGQSTGLAYIDNNGVHLRKAVGKVINFKAKYPDVPKTDICLSHSRWATTGIINEDNQHPISIMYKGKRIGYGVHNGIFSRYEDYEYLRNKNLKNQTDSALLFTIFSKILERYGDNRQNRIKALGSIRNLIKDENNNNLVIMFNNKQVIFSGNVLTYNINDNRVGIMTFGLPNKVDFDNIYEIKGYQILKYKYKMFDYVPKPKPRPKKKSRIFEEFKMGSQRSLSEFSSTNLDIPSFKTFDGDFYRLHYSNYVNQKKAQDKGEFLKTTNPNLKFRVVKNIKGLWSLYIRGAINYD